jgi:two-component system, cell cycle sensor histidine kinase and response regulator CckA
MTTPLRVLIVEDSEDDMALLLRELRRGGYGPTFERVDTAAGMTAALGQNQWDLVICDYSMPHFSGTDALRLLRSQGSDAPFIFLSGTIGEETAIAALKQGAQDYVMKDNTKRLLPAIQRELGEAEQRRERKRLEHQVQELQKFEAIGRLAGGIAHDFNNALGVILGWAQMGYDNVPDDSPVREHFLMIRDQAQRSAGLTRQLLAFARRQVLQPRSLNLNDLVSRISGLLRTAVGEQTELKIALTPGLQVTMADPTQIEQVLMNLCLNARDAMPQGGRIVIETSNVEVEGDFCRTHSYAHPGQYVLLSVCDTGVGMDAATLDRIFEPFFTTKEMGRGTGLGLATVYGIVKQHGGFVNVYSEPGQGTTFHVYLPASSGPPSAIERATSEAAHKGGTETILVAEDHEGLRELVRATLTSQGYSVILASDGWDAVRMFKANSEEIRLVVLDVVMPFLSGPEAHSQMCALRPDLPAIFMSGHVSESVQLNCRIRAGAVFLQKPYTPQTLTRTVRRTLDAIRAAQR